jgi:hypothetical protein
MGTATGEESTIKQQQQQQQRDLVLKVTSISSRNQRDIAEMEAKLLPVARLSHPSIVKMFDTGYRTVPMVGSSSVVSGFLFRHEVVQASSTIDVGVRTMALRMLKIKNGYKIRYQWNIAMAGTQYRQRLERFD